MKKRCLIFIAAIAMIACFACLLVACDGTNAQSVIRHVVIFDSKCDLPIQICNVENGSKVVVPTTPTKDGYKFVCWKNAADDREWNFAEDSIIADTVLYAEWREIEQEPELPTYLVVLDSKGNEPIRFEYVKEGSKVAAPPIPTKDGYTFVCWKNAADDREWNFAEDSITADTVLYAEWQEIEQEPTSHLVIIDSNNDGEPMRYLMVKDGKKIDEPEVSMRYGFDCVGWKNVATDMLWDFENDVVIDTVLLVAEWSEWTKYTIAFEYDDGTLFKKDYVYEGEKITEPDDHIIGFKGWKNVATGEAWNFDDKVYSDLVLCVEKFFIKPCNGTVLYGYDAGFTMNPSMGGQFETHYAIDFISDDLNVFAAADGVITAVGYNGLDGNYIVIEHSDGYVTKYYSLAPTTLEIGDQVTQGQIIGQMSDSKGSEYHKGTHLHFEVYKDGKVIDPTPFI